MDKKLCEDMIKTARSWREKTEAIPVKGRCITVKLRSGEREMYFYRAQKARAGAVLVLHGGGFLYGSSRNCDSYCTELSSRLDRHVISVDYTTSDEAPFPTGLEDVCDAVNYFIDNAAVYGIDKDHIALVGHSAGGNLAAAAALALKEGSLDALVLDYPLLDQTKKSLEAQGAQISPPSAVFRVLYCPEEKRGEPLVSPLYAQDEMLAKYPRTAIFAAEHDTLRYEGEIFAKRLEGLGKEVCTYTAMGIEHGYIEMELDLVGGSFEPRRRAEAMKVIDLTAQFLR